MYKEIRVCYCEEDFDEAEREFQHQQQKILSDSEKESERILAEAKIQMDAMWRPLEDHLKKMIEEHEGASKK